MFSIFFLLKELIKKKKKTNHEPLLLISVLHYSLNAKGLGVGGSEDKKKYSSSTLN